MNTKEHKTLLINLIKKGNLFEIQDFLYKNPSINISDDNEFAFCQACINGYLDVAKWLLTFKPDIDIGVYKNSPFHYACNFEHIEIAKLIYSLKPDVIKESGESAFHTACFNGNLELAKWIISIEPNLKIIFNAYEGIENIDSDDNEVSTFVTACSSGNFELVKWLFEIRPDIKISEYTAFDAFVNACHKGRLDIAKFILEKKPNLNIREQNDFTFFNTCVQADEGVDGCFETAQWLTTLCSDYKITEEPNDYFKFEIIRTQSK